MKITKSQLKQIIKEEISRTLDENEAVPSQATTEAAQEIRNLMTGGDPIGSVRSFLVKNKKCHKMKNHLFFPFFQNNSE